MIFAKIDFINLLPFHVYIKRHIKSNQLKAIIEHHKSYPSKINHKFKRRKVDSAFISSIASRGEKSLPLGIIAKADVQSVLLIPGKYSKDYQSETSNALAKVLGLEGQVLIGDKALKYFHEHPNKDEFLDLAVCWQEKYNLPFVFALLCFNKHEKRLKKVTKKFNKRHIKIPQYILKQYEARSGIKACQITEYLKKIDYAVGIKEQRAIKLFLQLTKGIK